MREAFRFRSFSIPFTKRFLFACGVHEAFEFTKPSNSRSDVLGDKGKTDGEKKTEEAVARIVLVVCFCRRNEGRTVADVGGQNRNVCREV